LAIELAPELLDLQLQACDQRFGAGSLRRQPRDLRLGGVCPGLFGGQSRLQFGDLGEAVFHTWSLAKTSPEFRRNLRLSDLFSAQPARDGRQVWRGLRQSMPSRR